MPRTIKLSRSLKTHSGVVNELTLRDLDAGDLVDMKVSPVVYVTTVIQDPNERSSKKTVDVRSETKFDVAFEYLSILSGVEQAVLRGMKGNDMVRATTALMEMWNENMGESVAVPGTSSEQA